MVEQGNLIKTHNKKTDVTREGVPEDDRKVEVKYTGRTRRGAKSDEDEEDDDNGGTGEDVDLDDDDEENSEEGTE
jgi:hypothetical protein